MKCSISATASVIQTAIAVFSFAIPCHAQNVRTIDTKEECVSAAKTLALVHNENLSRLRTWQGDFKISRLVHRFEKALANSNSLVSFVCDLENGAKYCEYGADVSFPAQKLLETEFGNFRVDSIGRKLLTIYPPSPGTLIRGKAYGTICIDPLWLLEPHNFSMEVVAGNIARLYPFDEFDDEGNLLGQGTVSQNATQLIVQLDNRKTKRSVEHVYDFSLGGNLISHVSKSPTAEYYVEREYVKVNGVFVPSRIHYKEFDVRKEMTKFDVTFTFVRNEVNSPIAKDAFDPRKNGIMDTVEGVTDLRTFVNGAVDRK